MRSRLSRHLRPLAASIALLGTAGVLVGTAGGPLAASVACGCEGEKEIILIGFSPGDLTWLGKAKGAQSETIEPLKGNIKLIKQSTNDEKDFGVTDPNGCMGKSLTVACTITVTRKTEAVTGIKRYILEYEEEASKLVSKNENVKLEGR